MLLGEYLVPRLPWKQISKAHHWKCWTVGLPERDRREADWQTQTETAGNKGYYRVAVAWGWRNWGLEGRNTDLGDNCSIYMYKLLVVMQKVDRDLAVWGCEWAVRLYGPQAWMTHSTWTHRHVVRRKQLNLVRKENISFTSSQVQDSCCRITASTSHAYCTLARHLATNQLTDHLSPSQVNPSPPSPHPTANPFNAVIKVSLCILCSGRHGLP